VNEQFLNGTSAQCRLYTAMLKKLVEINYLEYVDAVSTGAYHARVGDHRS